MGFLWFGKNRKKQNDEKNEKIKVSFEKIKQDIAKINSWIRHLNSCDNHHSDKIELIYTEIMNLRQNIDEIKSFISFFDTRLISRLSKQPSTAVDKHTAVEAVQTPVYTAVYTAFLRGLTQSERMILWALLNSDMKLSYEDLAVLFGKDSSTIRSQINNIKQKNENWISETIEKNGKKRLFIDEKIKEMLLKNFKSMKVRQKSKKGGND